MGHLYPDHQRQISEIVARAYSEPIRVAIEIPPRHGLSTCLIDTIVGMAARDSRMSLYVAHSTAWAENSFDRATKDLLDKDGQDHRLVYRNNIGGGVEVCSPGDITHFRDPGAGPIVIDSPFWHGRSDALPVGKIWDWISRLQCDDDTSVIAAGPRLHGNDILGRFLGIGFDRMTFATSPDNVLWPSRWSSEQLAKVREHIGRKDFSAMYMQEVG